MPSHQTIDIPAYYCPIWECLRAGVSLVSGWNQHGKDKSCHLPTRLSFACGSSFKCIRFLHVDMFILNRVFSISNRKIFIWQEFELKTKTSRPIINFEKLRVWNYTPTLIQFLFCLSYSYLFSPGFIFSRPRFRTAHLKENRIKNRTRGSQCLLSLSVCACLSAACRPQF